MKAGAYTNTPGILSSFANPAALAKHTSFSVGAYGDRRFLLEELASFSGAFILPVQSGAFGLQVKKFGNGLYNEFKGGLSYGRALGENIHFGLGFNYHVLSLQSYGSSSALSFDVGAIFNFTDELHGGMHFSQPTNPISGSKEENMPSLYGLGLGYDVSDKLFINTEIEKYSTFPTSLHISLQYKFTSSLFTKGGISTAPSTFFISSGVTLNDFILEAVASIHPQLGLTPGLLIVYQKKKE
jgi:hypothetical protein